MTDLNSLALFAKVVEAGSFSEAARRLKMPISTVSRRIAELEDQLGVRLLERSTRNLRLTELGAEVLEHAVRSAELNEAVESVISNRLSDVSGTLKLSAPPSVSDTLLTPLVTAFQASYPNVRVQILVTERLVDLIAEGVDLAFRLGTLKDSCLVARRVLTYRHQLVASPFYLKACKPPNGPQDLLDHRLLTFSHWKPENSWTFVHKNGMNKETLTFQPHISMNDYTGLAARPGRRGRDRGTSASRPARAHPGRPSSRGYARLAVPHLRPFARPDREPPHHQAMPALQGSRGAYGAKSVSRFADVSDRR
jgi:DNA-binding transcriptional LysR family regulator